MSTGKLKTLCAKFRRDEQGNFLMIFAFATMVIFMCAGLAVEYSQAINIKTRMNNALDAATLATARAIQIGEITEDEGEEYLKDVFLANVGLETLDGSLYELKEVVINPVTQEVSAKATYDQDLDFISVGAHQDTTELVSSTGAVYGVSDAEVAFVLDTTGSMGGSKIEALREAAILGVEELLSVNTVADEKIRISLVPYAYAVNAGPLAKYVFPDFEYYRSNAPAFDAALYASTGVGFDTSDWIDVMDDAGVDAGSYAYDNNPGDDCGTDRKRPISGTNHQATDAGPGNGMISRDPRLPDGQCPDLELMLLSSDETALTDHVAGLPAAGWTAGHIGLQWAYYTISHEWADYVPAAAKPADHTLDDANVSKYIILMTDGEFNTAYADIQKYGSDWQAGRQKNRSRNHAGSLCTDIKNNDVRIFTIGFQLTNDNAINMLKACATPDQGDLVFHYEPVTSDELKDTYKQIAQTIQKLVLVQ